MLLNQSFKSNWPLVTKIAFRFIFLFLTGFIFLMITSFLWSPILVWIGEHIFFLKENLELKSTGSGDSTMSWLSVFLQFIIAVIGTIIWSVMDRKRPSYNRLFYWSRVIIRSFVALFMLLYGFAKLFLIQFSEPSLVALQQPLGNMSPMGLAWTYMGFSPAFQIFTGLLEVIAGLLLIPRRTQTAGALMVVGVMTHVAVMNLCFDIPVKIFSIHLVLMGLYLVMSDFQRIKTVLFRSTNEVRFEDYKPIDQSASKVIGVLKIIIITILILGASGFAVFINTQRNEELNHHEFYGIWNVTEFIKNQDTIPPSLEEENRWRNITLNYKDRSSIRFMNDSIKAYYFKVDSTAQFVSIYKKDDLEEVNNFMIEHKDSLHIQIAGKLGADSLKVTLKATDLSKFRLPNRGFHWVNESPYNR